MPTATMSRPALRVVGGVCSGFATHTGLPVGVVRLVTAALAVCGGAGVLLYAWLWATTPSLGPATPVPLKSVLTEPADDADAEGDTYRLWSVSLTDPDDVRDEDLTVGDVAFTDTSMVWTDRTNGDSGRVHVRDLATGEEQAFDPRSGARCNLLSFGATADRACSGSTAAPTTASATTGCRCSAPMATWSSPSRTATSTAAWASGATS